MQLAPNSQEPETPAVPAGPGPARTRHRTRRSRTVEEVAQTELLAGGDEAEVREVCQVQEVVKTVAVVRGRGGGVAFGSAPRVEEVSEGAEEGAGAPRHSGRRGATAARLEEELDEVMARGTGRRRAGASPGAVVRTEHTVEVTEGEAAIGGEEEEEEWEEEAPAEEGGMGGIFFTPVEEEEALDEEIEISEDDFGDLGVGIGGDEEEEEEAATEVQTEPEDDAEHGEEESGPRTPGKLLRGALAAAGETLRCVLGGHHEQEQQEEPMPTPRAAPRHRGAKLKPAPTASARKKARRVAKRHAETYKRYVYAVLKQVHPELGISSRAMEVMHAFMVDAFERLAEAAAQLTKVAHRRTLGARDVQTAARLVLPGTLADHAVQEGKRAVLRFEKAG